jgi:hypothetical protein
LNEISSAPSEVDSDEDVQRESFLNEVVTRKVDPLDFIDQAERNVNAEVRRQVEEYFNPKMVLTLKSDPERIRNLILQQIRAVNVGLVKTETQSRFKPSISGSATVIHAYPHICIGTASSEVAVFKDYELALVMKPSNVDAGEVTTIDQWESFVAVGYEKALLILWDSSNGALLKSINHHCSTVIAVRFYQSARFLSSDITGALCSSVI